VVHVIDSVLLPTKPVAPLPTGSTTSTGTAAGSTSGSEAAAIKPAVITIKPVTEGGVSASSLDKEEPTTGTGMGAGTGAADKGATDKGTATATGTEGAGMGTGAGMGAGDKAEPVGTAGDVMGAGGESLIDAAIEANLTSLLMAVEVGLAGGRAVALSSWWACCCIICMERCNACWPWALFVAALEPGWQLLHCCV